ncbi:type II toxin-antitoxin system VapC family toxin [Kosakonia oryzendophytica]|uniref:type II toxin-antitoxin system VapC family toxin n=1 Tax=Kosakonia oryzendophytica TaxID=1005665 RepID=UPI003D33A7CF
MTRNVLLDTNLLIAALDSSGRTSDEMKESATAILTGLLNDVEVKLFITPLIRYEVLRGVPWLNHENFNKLQNTLNQFPELDITRNISELSANLFRYDSWLMEQPGAAPRNLEKRKFDVFHFSSASCNRLELCSNDSDIGKIRSLHDEYKTFRLLAQP